MQPKLHLQRLPMLLLPFLVMVFTSFKTVAQTTNAYSDAGLSAPIVTSDKDDYAPGEVAHITGTGWTLDQGVHVEFKESPDYPDYHIYDVNVDTNGNWSIDYPIEVRHLGVKFTVVAYGKQSSVTATTVFTDAPGVITITSVSPNSGPFNTTTPVTITGTNFFADNGQTGSNKVTYSYQVTFGSIAVPATISGTSGTTLTSNAPAQSSSIGNVRVTVTRIPNKIESNSSDFKNNAFTYQDASTNLSVNSASGTQGSTTTLKAILTSNGSGISGKTITFKLNGTTVSPTATTDANGIATLTNVSLGSIAVGSYSTGVTATFAGDNDYITSSGSGSLTVIPAQAATSLSVSSASGTYGGTTTLTATLTSGGSGVSGKSINFTLTGNSVGSATTDNTGKATLPNVSIAGINASNAAYVNAIGASFTADPGYLASSGNGNLTVNKATATITLTAADLSQTYNGSGKTVSYITNPTGMTGVTVTYSQGGNTVTNPTNAGDYDVVASLTNNNYQADNATGSLVIDKATATVTLGNLSPTYDGNPKSATATTNATGTSSFTFTYDGSSTAPTDAASYNVVATLVNDNYKGSATGAFVIQQAANSITFTNPGTKAYGDVPFSLSGSATSGGAVSFEVTSGPASINGNTLTITGAGEVTVKASSAATTNYKAAVDETQTFTVNKASLTVTANNKGKTYGDDDPALDYRVTGLQYNDADDVVSGVSLSTATGSGATYGTHPITISGATATNYTITQVAGTLTVSKATLSVVNTSRSKVYGETLSNTDFSGSLTGIVYGDGITVTRNSTGASAGAGVTTYPIVGSLSDPDSRLNNYTIINNDGTLTVTKAPLTVTANDKNKVYGNANPAFDADYSGFVNGEELATSGVAGNPGLTTSATTLSPVGDYPITAGAGNLTSANYSFTFVNGILSIGARTLTVTASNKTKTYGEVVTFDGTEFTTGDGQLVGTDKVNSVSLNSTGAVATASVAGSTYPIVAAAASGAGLNNYTIGYVNGALTVNKAPLTVKANDDSKTYNAQAYSGGNDVTYTGLVNGEEPSVLSGTLSYTGSSQGAIDAGSYVITPAGLTSGNYTINFDNGTLTVKKASLTVENIDRSKVYGQTLGNADFAGNITGVATGDNITVTRSSTGAVASAGVTTYPIIGTLSDPNHRLDNYNVTNTNGTLTVTQATLTVTADDQNKTYGDANPALTVNYSGFVNGEGTSVLSTAPAATTTATQSSGVGIYPIIPAGGVAANYSFTYVNGTLTIDKRSVTITAEAKSKTYGDADPALTYNITSGSLAAGDGFSGSLSRIAGESVGSSPYAINQGNVALNPANYNLSYIGADLTINQKAASVAPAPASKAYGTSDPLLTGTLSGFLAADGVTAVYSRTAGESVAGNPYTISAALSPASVLGNYKITYNTASFTIGKATITVSANGNSRQYSDPNPALTGTITGVVSGDGITASYTTTANAASDPGTYVITPVLSDPNNKLGNYIVNSTNGILTVTKEDAKVDYTGALSVATSSTSSGSAIVTLSATLRDISAVTDDPATDSYPGDIRKAKIRFLKEGGLPIINTNSANGAITDAQGWTTVGLVNTADAKTGTVLLKVPVDIGAADANQFTYTIQVGSSGYYTTGEDEDIVVNVYKPFNDFVTGGGYIIPTRSNGTYAAAFGRKSNFGFNIRYNKTGKSLQGNINVIFKRKESDGILHIYQVKGNSMTSLSVDASVTTAKKATFNGKANMQDITIPTAPISMGGNLTLQVTMTDRGEPGKNDQIGIAVYNNSGGILYSSDWDGVKTSELYLAGGNLLVNSGGTTTITTTAIAQSAARQGAEDTYTGQLKVTAFPNPAPSQFTLQLQSNNIQQEMMMIVVNQSGRVIETRQHLTAGQTIQLGSAYRPGVYFVQVIQGDKKEQVKLVKLSN